jgi:hypothetical protein
MKNIFTMITLAMILVAAIAINVITPDIDYSDARYFPASDTVTASCPYWPTLDEQVRGVEILNSLIEQNK